MYGVVSLLDQKHYRLVEELWADLDHRFGVRGIAVTPFPHFSYHVAAGYDLMQLKPILKRLARDTAAFTVTTAGLGVFSGPEPVIYIPVARNPILTVVHEQVWHQVESTSNNSVRYYRPQAWFPHITLGHGDIDVETLADIVRWLGGRPLNWQIGIDNFAVLGSDTEPHKLVTHMQFG